MRSPFTGSMLRGKRMKAQDKVEKARQALRRAESKLSEVCAKRRILCSCGKRHAINTLELIVTHWYVEPYSCSSGGYWNEGEWQFRCPTSKKINRIMFDDYGVEYEKRNTVGVAGEPTFKSIYRGLFKSRVDVHDKDKSEPFHNNFYVDEHRKAFDLPARAKRD